MEESIVFTNQDKKRMGDLWQSPGFKDLDDNQVKNLFLDRTDNPEMNEVQGYRIPEQKDEKDVWPNNITNWPNELKGSLYFEPHKFIPSSFYLLNPLAALRSAVVFVFKALFGEKASTVTTKLGRTDSKYFAPFQKFYSITLDIWSTGTISKENQAGVNDHLIASIFLAGADLLNANNSSKLSLTSQNLEEMGIDPQVGEATAKAKADFKDAFNRANAKTYINYQEVLMCGFCLSENDTVEELNDHLTTCLAQIYTPTLQAGVRRYTCETCQTEQMSLENCISHMYTFCVVNVRAKCPYCTERTKICRCARSSLKVRTNIYDSVENSNEIDLMNPKNAVFLGVYLKARIMESEENEGMDSLLNGNDLKAVIRKQEELGFEVDTGKARLTISLDKALESLRTLNVDMEGLYQIYEHLNPRKLQDTCFPEACHVCLGLTEPYHLETCHPTCFCSPHRFKSVKDLMNHFKSHQTQLECPECFKQLKTVYELASHQSSHEKSKSTETDPCLAAESTGNLPICKDIKFSKHELVKHMLVYHINNNTDWQDFATTYRTLNGTPIDPHREVPSKIEDPEREDSHLLKTTGGIQRHVSFQDKDTGTETKGQRVESKKVPTDQEYRCPNDTCSRNNVKFQSETDLKKHIRTVHKCRVGKCKFISTDDNEMSRHMFEAHISKEPTESQCSVCFKTFPDSKQLSTHVEQNHFLACKICNSQNFATRQSLIDHEQECVNPTMEEGIADNPILMLIDKLLKKGPEMSQQDLLPIKACALKHIEKTKNPELILTGHSTFFEVPLFPENATPLSIPTSRIRDLPKFFPLEGKPLKNYSMMHGLIQELVYLIEEFKIDEHHFVSILVQKMNTEAKTQLKSILNCDTIAQVRLEKVLESCRFLFYDIDTQSVYSNSVKLTKELDETMVQFFSRAKSITRLASYYLKTNEEMEAFRISNLRLQLLQNTPKDFADMIKKRELQNGTTYSPVELLKIYLNYERSGKTNRVQVNRVEADISHQLVRAQAQAQSNPQGAQRTGARPRHWTNSKFRREGLQGRPQRGLASRKETKRINQVSDTRKPMTRIKPTTAERFKILNMPSNQLVCFLCGNKHLARACKAFPNMPLQDKQCNVCKRWFHEDGACRRGGQIIRN